MSYFIKSYGDYTTIYAEGPCEYGQHCVVNLSFEQSAYYAFVVYLKNSKGQSSPAPTFSGVPTYVGTGTPKAPENVALTITGNTASLTWSPVTACVESGNPYINPSEVTYNVVRMPGDVKVAEGISATSFTEPVPAHEGVVGYSYKVTASFGDKTSGATLSNAVTDGTVTPAWSCDLTSRDGFNCFSVIDGNNDQNTWEYDAYGFTQVDIYNNWGAMSNPKDEWLISPPLSLEGGKMYPVIFTASSYNSGYTEKFEVMGGAGATVADLTTTIVAPTDVCTESKDLPVELKGFFTAPATGTYYIALHAITPGKTYDCFARGFSIGDGIEGRTPAAVDNFSATSDPDDGVKAVISFNAPALNNGGIALTAIDKIEIERDGTVIKTFSNPAPGAALTYTDENATEDYHTYKVTAFNEFGAGKPVEANIIVGDNRPYPPYTCALDEWLDLAPFTIIDGDGDGRKWSTYSGEVRCESNVSGSNDLIVLPALWLTKDHRYKFSADMRSEYNGEINPFEFVFGTEPTLEGMNTVLLDVATPEGGYDPVTYTAQADITESGLYYFGIRYKCAEYGNYIFADNVTVNEGMATTAPAKIDDLTVTPDFGGALKATVAFTAPATDLVGNALTVPLEKIEVERDGALVKTFENAQPGAALSYEDNATRGYHIYKVTSYNGIYGESAETRVYVGANVPLPPVNATVVETATPGEVEIAWEAPTLDVDGNTLNPALLTFTVMRASLFGAAPQIVAERISAKSYKYQAVPEDSQEFVYYYVYAVTDGGASTNPVATDIIPAGTPDKLPYRESFAEGTISHAFCSEREGDYPGDWTAYNDQQMANLEPQDSDNGVLAFYAPYGTAISRLITGKVDLTSAVNPHFSLWYYSRQDCTCQVVIGAREAGNDNEFVDLKRVVCDDSDGSKNTGWVKVDVDLSPYKGKIAQVVVRAIADQHAYMMFDNFRIADMNGKNLTAVAISAPSVVNAGEPAEIKVTYENSSAESVGNGEYTVDLYRNGEKVQTISGQAIAPDELRTAVFTENPTVAFPTELVYHAEITMEADSYNGDNATDPAEMTLRLPVFPAVNDLAAESVNGVNNLTWSAPALTVTPAEPVTDSFETYNTFEKKNLGEWLLVDADGENFGGFGSLSLPGINGPMSFFVMDAAYEGLPNDPMGQLSAHTGTKYMVSGWCGGPTKASDDWLISPRVSLSSNILKFFAKSYDDTMLESMQVLASSGSRNIDEFALVQDVKAVPVEWTEYSVTLPEGSRYFAIRCNSVDRFMLFVDDVTYTPVTATSENLEILGYNVYRNGEKINEAAVAAPGFSDDKTAIGDNVRYVVTAVYDQGESAPSNEALITTSALDGIAASDISVTVADGFIVVTGAQGREVTLCGVDGRVFARVTGAQRTIIPAPQGVVIVRAGGVTAKVVVK